MAEAATPKVTQSRLEEIEYQDKRSRLRSSCNRHIASGGAILLLGIVVTLSGIGLFGSPWFITLKVFWGAMFAGGVQLIYGLTCRPHD
jgi:hypothetical protein